MNEYKKQLKATRQIKGFRDGYLWREDLAPRLREMYECIIQSELADHFDGEKRLDIYWLIKDLIRLIKAMRQLNPEITTLIETVEKQYDTQKRQKKNAGTKAS